MKTLIKMNDGDYNLSLGNLFRLIKSSSKNKSITTQSFLFSLLFFEKEATDTTINNYCVGYRSIGEVYKNTYKENINSGSVKEIVSEIENVLERNNSTAINDLANSLYSIAKNDKDVDEDYLKSLYNAKDKNIYEFFKLIFDFVVLYKRQPQYIEEEKKLGIEKYLYSSLISTNELEEYLNIKFNEGINVFHSLKLLANKKNAYAAYDVGMEIYKKALNNRNKYKESFDYFKIAAEKKHPGALHVLAKFFINNLLNTRSDKTLKDAFNYLNDAISLGNVGATNTLGLMYLKGTYPTEKNIKKAEELFKQSAKENYSYAYNNLGLLYEKNKEYSKALKYYKESSSLGNSWASNKVGEFYRKGLSVEENLYKAYKYYKKSIEEEIINKNFYNYYNLAKYFYLNGFDNIKKNTLLAEKYFKIAAKSDIIEAQTELLYLYSEKYLKTNNYKYKIYIDHLIKKIESNKKFNETIKKEIDSTLLKIKNKIKIKKDYFN